MAATGANNCEGQRLRIIEFAERMLLNQSSIDKLFSQTFIPKLLDEGTFAILEKCALKFLFSQFAFLDLFRNIFIINIGKI